MKKNTEQMKKWLSNFGDIYTKRSMYSVEEMDQMCKEEVGITRTDINQEFIGNFDRSTKILEVATNIGTQLLCLQKMGFKNLYGIELQKDAVEIAKNRTKYINIIQGSAFDIPFKDGFFDLVCTSGLLIHISPSDILNALSEIHRCSKKYIWGYEYFAKSYQKVKYRGCKDLLWKTDFVKLYLDNFKDLRLVKEKRLKCQHNENVDTWFLLEKE